MLWKGEWEEGEQDSEQQKDDETKAIFVCILFRFKQMITNERETEIQVKLSREWERKKDILIECKFHQCLKCKILQCIGNNLKSKWYYRQLYIQTNFYDNLVWFHLIVLNFWYQMKLKTDLWWGNDFFPLTSTHD